ncbi:MAG: TonB-dependent receptor [Gemmatimonadota bacterium]
MRNRGGLRTAYRIACLAVVACVWPMAVAAQSGTVQGSIHDDEGAAVFGATVALFAGERVVQAVETDRLGQFRLSRLPPGSFEVRAGALGYAEHVEVVDLAVDGTVELDIRLERSAFELEGISVQAERSRARVRFEEVGGTTVREMDIETVQLIPGVAEPDPVRAIEVLPGVVSTSDYSAAFHVRGGSQDQNLILLDGIPIFSPFHLGGLFSVFNADMIDRVELQSGGFPAEHGGRVSAVLDIESDAGERDTRVDGAVSLLSARSAVGGRLPDGFASALGQESLRYRVSARRSYFDVLFRPAFDFPYHLQDVQAFVEGWSAGGDRLTFTAYTGRDVFNLSEVDSDFPLRIDWDWGNDLVGIGWTRPRRGGGSLGLKANFSRFKTGLVFPDFGDTDFRSRIQQGQVRLDLDTRPTPEWAVQVGSSVERLSYLNSFLTGGTEFGGGEGTGLLAGAYAQARWTKPRSWLIEMGVRGDAYTPNPGETVTELSPRLAVKRFMAGGDVALKIAAGRYTQFLHSLRDEELPLGLDIWILAGQQAPHTVSDQIQAGIEGYIDIDWFWSLEGYYRDFDGVVSLNNADNPNDDGDDILAGTGVSWGVDAMIRKETGAVTGWTAVSFLKADRSFPDPLSPRDPAPIQTFPPIFDRRVDVDFVLRYPAPWGWEGGLRWNFGTGIPFTRALGAYAYYTPRYVEGGGLDWTGSEDNVDREGGYGVVVGSRNGARYPNYHRLDVSFRRNFEKSWGSMTPYVNLVNAYNQRNVLFYFFEYFELPPTRAGISMFPVLPTIGMEISF